MTIIERVDGHAEPTVNGPKVGRQNTAKSFDQTHGQKEGSLGEQQANMYCRDMTAPLGPHSRTVDTTVIENYNYQTEPPNKSGFRIPRG